MIEFGGSCKTNNERERRGHSGIGQGCERANGKREQKSSVKEEKQKTKSGRNTNTHGTESRQTNKSANNSITILYRLTSSKPQYAGNPAIWTLQAKRLKFD